MNFGKFILCYVFFIIMLVGSKNGEGVLEDGEMFRVGNCYWVGINYILVFGKILK